MTKNGWKQIVVREDTYRLFQKYRGLLMAREERKIRLAEGKIKVADVVVAGTDRWGTYGACDLLQG